MREAARKTSKGLGGRESDKDPDKDFWRNLEVVGRDYLSKRCSILFSTCKSMGRREASAFPASYVLIDNAAMASTADLAVPLVAVRHTMKVLILSGDRTQSMASSPANGRNEVGPWYAVSPFERLMESPGQAWRQTLNV